MKVHPENLQFIILRNTGLHILQISDMTTKLVSSVTLLSITINSKLNFKENINNIIKKAYYKLCTLRRRRINQILACSMIESQFAHCPLIWMSCLKIEMQRVENVQ